MEKQMNKSFLMTATEVKLITMPFDTIFNEVVEHYNDLLKKAQGGEISSKVSELLDQRLAHSSILMEEGKRLAVTHPQLAKHLTTASIYWQAQQGMEMLIEAERETLLKRVEEIGKKREEEKKKNMKMKDNR